MTSLSSNKENIHDQKINLINFNSNKKGKVNSPKSPYGYAEKQNGSYTLNDYKQILS